MRYAKGFIVMDPVKYEVNYANKFLMPGPGHIFGTDFVGRDMFYRCIKGLSNSLIVGVLASVISSIIALVFGIAGTCQNPTDYRITKDIPYFVGSIGTSIEEERRAAKEMTNYYLEKMIERGEVE